MFGILKKKLSGFSEKLKQTLSEKAQQETPAQQEAEQAPEIKTTPEEVKPVQKAPEIKIEAPKVDEVKKEEPKKKTKEEKMREVEEKLFKEIGAELGEEIKAEPIIEEKAKPLPEIKKETPLPQQKAPEERKIAEPKMVEEKKPVQEIEKPKPEKKGFLGKLFGGKKKEEAPVEPKPIAPQQPAQKEVIVEKVTEKKEEVKVVEAQKEKQVEKVEAPKELELEEETALEEKELVEEVDVLSQQRMEEKRKQLEKVEIKGAEEDKRELKASVGTSGKLKGLIFGGVEINEKDLTDLLWELELSLIESDVEQDAARELIEKIKQKLIGQKVQLKNLDEYLKEQIKEILTEMMTTEKINLLELAKQKKAEGRPLTILMLGPNGAGKTTSIAKLAHLFQKNNMSVILAAGDTFRAAAIDQLEEHANKLGVRVVKQQYGADPAAVAFDAIRAAEAGKIDAVIIDSAGRQETNKNLMEELKKIERVAKPDLKIYVGEAYAGQGLLEQAQEFDSALGIDGFILTKIDADAKGGTTISLLYKIKKPIIYIGTGQGYDDFETFTPEYILNRII